MCVRTDTRAGILYVLKQVLSEMIEIVQSSPMRVCVCIYVWRGTYICICVRSMCVCVCVSECVSEWVWIHI
jgi:hypothetical protein